MHVQLYYIFIFMYTYPRIWTHVWPQRSTHLILGPLLCTLSSLLRVQATLA